MPFLYSFDGDAYARVRSDIPLAGLNGSFCAASCSSPDHYEWELSEDALIGFFGVDPDRDAVPIDLKPRVPIELIDSTRHPFDLVAEMHAKNRLVACVFTVERAGAPLAFVPLAFC
jgi:hypothetical protein